MKKWTALLLICMLTLPLPVLADTPAVCLSGFFASLLQPASNVIRYTPAPFGALPSEDHWVIAGTSDGQKLLVSDIWLDAYVWDGVARTRLPLTFARQEDAELFILRFESLTLMRLKTDQRASAQERLAANREKYLAQHGLDRFQTLNQVLDCFGRGETPGRIQCLQGNDRYACLVNYQVPFFYLLDWETAKIQSMPDEMNISLCGDRFLHCDQTGQGAILDLTTWEETPVSLLQSAYGQVKSVTGVHLFPDGSVALLGRSDMVRDEESKKMLETDYFVLNAGRTDAVCLTLGDSVNMQSPNQILCTDDGGYALVNNTNWGIQNGAILIDLKACEATAIAPSLVPVAGLDSIFLCYDMNAAGTDYYTTLRPDTRETAVLASDSGGADPGKLRLWGMTALVNANLRCGDLLFSQAERLPGYFTLNITADEE